MKRIVMLALVASVLAFESGCISFVQEVNLRLERIQDWKHYFAPKNGWVCDPYIKHVRNVYFDASITLFGGRFENQYEGILLVIQDKFDEDLMIDWRKSQYIYKGRRLGGFMFKETDYRDRNKPKPPEFVTTDQYYHRFLWPNQLTRPLNDRGDVFERLPMKAGDHGIYLMLVVDGEELPVWMTVSLRPA